MGGGSCLNAGFFTRASSDFVAKSGWDPKLVEQSYEWVEKKVAFEPNIKQWQTAVRDGLLEAGILPNNGFTYDHIIGTKVGGSIFDNNGHRHTAADLLEYANPSSIALHLHATVQKILFDVQGTYLINLKLILVITYISTKKKEKENIDFKYWLYLNTA